MELREDLQESLRARTVGDILDATFRQYRRHFSFWFPLFAVIFIPFLVLQVILLRGTTTGLQSLVANIQNSGASPANPTQIASQVGFTELSSIILLFLQYFIFGPLIIAGLTRFLSLRTFERRTLTVRQAISHGFRRLPAMMLPILIRTVLYFAGFIVVGIVVSMITFGLVLVHIPVWLGAVLGVLGFLAGILALIFFTIRLSFLAPVASEEKCTGWTPIARSWVLTRRNFWRTLGLMLVTGLIVSMLGAGVNTAVAFLLPQHPILSLTISGVIQFFTLPISFLARANLYVDLRIRTDALDLEQWVPTTGTNELSNA